MTMKDQGDPQFVLYTRYPYGANEGARSMRGRRKCLQGNAAAKDHLEFRRLSASMILAICLEETGCGQVNCLCWAQNGSRRWDVGLCECGDEHSGYEAGRRFIGYLGYILLSISDTFFCEISQIISRYVLHLTTPSFAKVKWLQWQMDKMRLWRTGGKTRSGNTKVLG